jgi:hypothetical protein
VITQVISWPEKRAIAIQRREEITLVPKLILVFHTD